MRSQRELPAQRQHLEVDAGVGHEHHVGEAAVADVDDQLEPAIVALQPVLPRLEVRRTVAGAVERVDEW
jgi:hypothetical protein